jgi:hypothetical protein
MRNQDKYRACWLICFFFILTPAFALEAVPHLMQHYAAPKSPIKKPKTDKTIIGAVENVRIIPPDMVLKARIDTGAKTTSVDARNITAFMRKGQQWVRFDCISGTKGYTITKRVISTVQIKRHNKPPQTRFVVKMRITLGNVSRNIEVNLNNRDAYTYPVLIGRNFLRDTFIVDIVKRYRYTPQAYRNKK